MSSTGDERRPQQQAKHQDHVVYLARRAGAQVVGDPAAPVQRRRPRRRVPLRHLGPAGRVLPDPGPGPPISGRAFFEHVIRDFKIGKRLTDLPAPREIGITANRRLLGAGRLSHNPIRAAEAFTAVHDPIITDTGHRIAGLRLGDRRAHALLQALLVFRLHPNGFANRDLRACSPNCWAATRSSAGQMSYDLRRLRAHGLIIRVPGSHRYRLTETGLHHACCSATSTPDYCFLAWPSSPTPDPPAPGTRAGSRDHPQIASALEAVTAAATQLLQHNQGTT